MLRYTVVPPSLLRAYWSNSVTIHVVLFFCKLTGAKVLRYAVVPLQRQTTGATCYDTCCPLSFSQPTGATCYDTCCAFFAKPLEQRATRHVVLSLQLKASMVCDSISHVSCAGTLCFSKVQVTLRLCRTFSGFLGHPRKLGIAN